MATPTYELIERTTLSSPASSVTFSSITQDYRDLVGVVDVTMVSGFGRVNITFNNDTGSNYNYVSIQGASTSTASQIVTNNSQFSTDIACSSTTPGKGLLHIMDYSATDKYKNMISRESQFFATDNVQATTVANRWASTAAITTITFAFSSDFAAGSTFAIYGIAA